MNHSPNKGTAWAAIVAHCQKETDKVFAYRVRSGKTGRDHLKQNRPNLTASKIAYFRGK